MNFETRHIGAFGGNPADIIELTVNGFCSKMVEQITNLSGKVDQDFIQELKNLAEELEEHNEKVNNKNT